MKTERHLVLDPWLRRLLYLTVSLYRDRLKRATSVTVSRLMVSKTHGSSFGGARVLLE